MHSAAYVHIQEGCFFHTHACNRWPRGACHALGCQASPIDSSCVGRICVFPCCALRTLSSFSSFSLSSSVAVVSMLAQERPQDNAIEPTKVGKRVVVEGGHLKDGQLWVPKVVHSIDGNEFIELHARDNSFAKYCGLNAWTGNALLEHLREIRNKAVDAEMLRILKDEDPMIQASSLPKRARAQFDASKLPPVVVLDMPSVSAKGETVGATRITCTSETAMQRVVSMEATVAALDYIRVAAQAIDEGDTNCVLVLDAPMKRPRRTERITTTNKRVKPDYRRSSLFVLYKKEDGKESKHYLKPKVWEQHAIDETCDDLVKWLRLNDHSGESPGERCDSVEECALDGQAEDVEEEGLAHDAVDEQVDDGEAGAMND